MTHINFSSIPPLVSGFLFLIFGLFVYLQNRSSALNKSFFYICLTTFVWQTSWFFLFNKPSDPIATIIVKIGYSGILLLPVSYFYFILNFTNRISQKKLFIASSICTFCLFVALWYSKLFINGYNNFPWGYYPAAGPLHSVYLTLLTILSARGLQLFLRELNANSVKSHRRNQLLYMTWALLIYLYASTDFIVNYTGTFYPIGFVPITIFLFITGWGIIRHQLLDIEVVIRRTAVFAGLFAFAYGTFTAATFVGQEFFKGILGWNQWMSTIPTVLIITFALRPLENFLTDITEKFLFQKSYDYRELLRTFTNEILTVLDLQKLMDQTIIGLSKIIKLESASVLLLDKDSKAYKIMACSGIKDKTMSFNEPDALISLLKATHNPILRDKVADKIEEHSLLKEDFKRLNARLCLPIILHDNLIGILCLGMKKSGEDFSQEDVDILMTLARTEAIAISNAQLFDELSKTQAEAAQREKMAVIGTLAAGINHEICNPLGIVRGQCEMFLLNLRDGFFAGKTVEEMLNISADVMAKVIKETDRATGITKKLSGFARPSKRNELEEVYIEKETDEVIGLLGHDLKLNNIEFQKDMPSDFPMILADKKQIQEVLFNIIRNGAQAMDKKQGRIVISGYSQNGSAIVRISDNGSGIPQDKISQIFNPFYTTKAPGKGTGLGLFIVKQVVERNKGTIAVESEAGAGTTFILTFPAATKLAAA